MRLLKNYRILIGFAPLLSSLETRRTSGVRLTEFDLLIAPRLHLPIYRKRDYFLCKTNRAARWTGGSSSSVQVHAAGRGCSEGGSDGAVSSGCSQDQQCFRSKRCEFRSHLQAFSLGICLMRGLYRYDWGLSSLGSPDASSPHSWIQSA